MKKFSILFTILLACITHLYGQVNLNWAHGIGGVDGDKGVFIEIDSSNNMYLCGIFTGTVDFDPSPNVANLVATGSADIYLAKYDSVGNYIWAISFGGEYGDSPGGIKIDSIGNIFLLGNFRGTGDFDPGPGILTLSSFYSNIFFCKLNSNGELQWLNHLTSNDNCGGSAIKIGNNGDLIIGGLKSGLMDFDTDVGTYYINGEVFVCKYDENGDFIFAKGFNSKRCDAVILDQNDNIYFTGWFENTIDFDAGPGISNLTSAGSYDIYLAKLDISGNLIWVNGFGSVGADVGRDLKIDDNNNLYITGYFSDSIDFDPGIGTYYLYSESNSAFVCKTDTLGSLLWAKALGGSGASYGNSIAVNNNGDVYMCGNFANTVDFNTGPDTLNFTAVSYSDAFFLKLNSNGIFGWAKKLGGIGGEEFLGVTLDNNNIFLTGWFSSPNLDFDPTIMASYLSPIGITDIFFAKYTEAKISGHVFNDFNQNCILDSNENGIANRFGIINPGNIVVQTSASGTWFVESLPVGTYTITFDTTGNWTTNCNPIITFNVTNTNDLISVSNLGLISTNPCPLPTVSAIMNSFRICDTDHKILIRASNGSLATGVLYNGFVDLELDPLIAISATTLNYTTIGDNLYRFMIPDTLFPNQYFDFWLNTGVSCNTTLGQTLCIKAKIYPVDSCVYDTISADLPLDFTPCSLPWDYSSIFVDSWCQNDSIHFMIANTGTGDMSCYTPMRLFIDGQYIWLDSIQLLSGEIDTLIFPGDGRTWRLEVDQHPLHPGNSHPNTSIELCGNPSNWTSNLINILPLDDLDPFIDIYCGVATAPFDPNDKTGYPLGVTDSHYIAPNGKLDYIINFQNTGTDTAFTVIIRDTLDIDLNIFSVASGVASHPYTFTMHGPRVLEWQFNNILIPDSTTDEEGSHGFIAFTVNQSPNLPDGTEINNTAGIYFDFNPPVVTNTTSHIVNRDINLPSWNQQISIIDTSCFNYEFDNLMYSNSGQYFQINEDTLITLNLTIYPMTLDAGNDTTICLNSSIILTGFGAQNYSWDNSVQNGVSFIPTTSQIYHVSGTDFNNCLANDSIIIWVNDTIPVSNYNHSFNGFEITLTDSSSNDVINWYWTIDGDSIGITNSAQYLFTQNGNYEVCLIASNDCFSDTICKQITVTGIGIDELGASGNIKIYPNPTHSFFTIECTEVNNSPYEILDITGKIIRSGTLQKTKTTIDLSNEANGFYLLRTNGQTIKLIKQ